MTIFWTIIGIIELLGIMLFVHDIRNAIEIDSKEPFLHGEGWRN